MVGDLRVLLELNSFDSFPLQCLVLVSLNLSPAIEQADFFVVLAASLSLASRTWTAPE